MECFTEFDELQEALKRVRMDEDVMPYYKGRLVENVDSYCKIQKLLNAPEMQNSHRYLYDLDIENLTEDEIQKVDELFDLGVKKGFIDNSFEEEFEKEENPTAVIADEEPETETADQQPAPIPCWTILYSATKNGETKCGECYSNAISVSAAKADCLAKLNRFGYDNVSILAIEAGDPDCAGKCDCVKENDILKNRPHNAHRDKNVIEKEDGISEDDMLKSRPHNGAAAHNGHVHINEAESPEDEALMRDVQDALDDAGVTSVSATSVDHVTGANDGSPYCVLAFTPNGTLEAFRGEDDVITFSIQTNDNAFGETTDPVEAVAEWEKFKADATVSESGRNPYAAGLKVVAGGKTSAPAKSKRLKEDDEDSGEDDASEDGNNADDSDDGDSDSEDSDSEDSGSGDASDGEDSDADDSKGEDSGEGDSDSDGEGDSDSEDSDNDEDSNDEDSDGEDDSENKKELTDDEKAQYRDEYRRVFKEVMLKCGFEDLCFNDLSIDDKVKFFETLKERWTKNDPVDFMSSKESDQLEAVVVTK